jgi:hypothetical protein
MKAIAVSTVIYAVLTAYVTIPYLLLLEWMGVPVLVLQLF